MMEKTYFSTIDSTELAWPVFRQQQDTGPALPGSSGLSIAFA